MQVSYCCNGKIERTSSGHRLQFEGSSPSPARKSSTSTAKLQEGSKRSPSTSSSPDLPCKSPARASSPNFKKYKPHRLSRANASEEEAESPSKDTRGKRAKTGANDEDSWVLAAPSRGYERSRNTVEQGVEEVTEVGGFVIVAFKSEAAWRTPVEPSSSDHGDQMGARRNMDGKKRAAAGMNPSSPTGEFKSNIVDIRLRTGPSLRMFALIYQATR